MFDLAGQRIDRTRDAWKKILRERVKASFSAHRSFSFGDEDEIIRRKLSRDPAKDFLQQTANAIAYHRIPDFPADRAPEPRMRARGVHVGDDREGFGVCSKPVALDARELAPMPEPSVARELPARADLDTGACGHEATTSCRPTASGACGPCYDDATTLHARRSPACVYGSHACAVFEFGGVDMSASSIFPQRGSSLLMSASEVKHHAPAR